MHCHFITQVQPGSWHKLGTVADEQMRNGFRSLQRPISVYTFPHTALAVSPGPSCQKGTTHHHLPPSAWLQAACHTNTHLFRVMAMTVFGDAESKSVPAHICSYPTVNVRKQLLTQASTTCTTSLGHFLPRVCTLKGFLFKSYVYCSLTLCLNTSQNTPPALCPGDIWAGNCKRQCCHIFCRCESW